MNTLTPSKTPTHSVAADADGAAKKPKSKAATKVAKASSKVSVKPAPTAAEVKVGKKPASGKAVAPEKASKAAKPVKPSAKKPAEAPRKKPAAKAPASPAEATKRPKDKLVRDSFTIPQSEYGQIDAIKLRAAAHGRMVKKSELLRAGLSALSALSDEALLKALAAVPSIKTGRPKAKK